MSEDLLSGSDDFEKLDGNMEGFGMSNDVSSTTTAAVDDLLGGFGSGKVEPVHDDFDDLAKAGDSDTKHDATTDNLLGSFSDSPKKEPTAPAPTMPTAPPKLDPFFEPDSTILPKQPSAPVEPETLGAKKENNGSGKCIFGETSCSWLNNMDPRVIDLIYWRDVRKTGVVFGSTMVTLLCLSFYSVLSVISYLSLALLTVTLSYRMYKNVLQAVQKSGDGHPFKNYLDMDIDLPADRVHDITDLVLKHVTSCLKALRRLFLVEDLVDSLKFALGLWVCTYVGSWFDDMTLIILFVVSIFTLPKVYETHKTQIDHYLDLGMTKVHTVWDQVKEKVPMLKKKQQ